MKRWAAAILILLFLLTGSACKYTKDGDEGYAPIGETAFPTRADSEKGTVPYIVAELIAKGQVIRDYIKLQTDYNGAIEGYRIRTCGIDVDIYRFDTESAFYREIVSLGAYPLKDEDGNLLSTVKAVVREGFVMLIPLNENGAGMDVTDLTEKLTDRFEHIKL